MKMKKIFLSLFVLVSLGEIISIFADVPLLGMICKPAVMITLVMYYWSSQQERQEPIVYPLMVAMLLSCLGDVLLMFQQTNPNNFMFGLGAFLLAHVFYILSYKQNQGEQTGNELQGLQKIRFAFPIVLSGTGLIVILYNHLGDLKIPVVVYAGVLTYMVLVALFRFGKTNAGSFAMVFGGAILFMISDSLIAINKFLEPISHAELWVMITYISAQFLIVRGLLKHQN
jgi:uncharacterized membrane protein YhhN